MSYNQVRSASNRKEMNHRNPLAQRNTNQMIPSPSLWNQPHHGSRFTFSHDQGQNPSPRRQYAMDTPVQELQRETERQRSSTEFYTSGLSTFDNRYMPQVLSENPGHPAVYNQLRNHPSSSTDRFTYAAQRIQTEPNRYRLYTDSHGSDMSRLSNGFVQRPDHRGYPCVHDSTNTGYGNFTASHNGPPPLPILCQPTTECSSNRAVTATNIPNHQRSDSDDEGLPAVVSEEKTFFDDASIDSPTNEHPRLLALPEDKSHLTALHCFVRRHCVYMFCAEANEVDGEFCMLELYLVIHVHA